MLKSFVQLTPPEMVAQLDGHLGGMPVQTRGLRIILKKWA